MTACGPKYLLTDSLLEEKWLTPALRTLSSHNYSTSDLEVVYEV